MKLELSASGIASQYSESKLMKPDILIDIYTMFNHLRCLVHVCSKTI